MSINKSQIFEAVRSSCQVDRLHFMCGLQSGGASIGQVAAGSTGGTDSCPERSTARKLHALSAVALAQQRSALRQCKPAAAAVMQVN
jgi:hypothetical protein